MELTLLVVDDDPYVRQLVRRVASSTSDVRLLEAENGVEALDALTTEHVDGVLLDMTMPVMDGLETLQALRRSTRFQELPVMVLTGRADEDRVTKVLKLGVAGFLVKPFPPSLLRERLAKLLRAAAARAESHVTHAPARIDVRRTNRVVLVDRAPDFCRLFKSQLSGLCEVESFPTLSDALSACALQLPDALFVGYSDGIIDTELFVRKVRQLARPRQTPIVGMSTTGDEESLAARSLFDAVLVRSYVPESLRQGLCGVLTETSIARWCLTPGAAFSARFAEKTRACVARLLGSDLRQADSRPAWASRCGRWVSASLEIHVGGLSWDLTMTVPYEAALLLASAVTTTEIDAVFEDDVCRGMAEVSTLVASMLADALKPDALALGLGAPRIAVMHAPPDAGARTTGEATSQWWFSIDDAAQGVAVALIPLGDVA